MSVLSGVGLSAYADPSMGMMGASNTPATSTGGGNSSSSSTSQSGPVMIPGMQQVYSQLLGLNQQNYGNVMNAYSQGQSNINNQMPQISQGYNNLGGQIQNTLGMGQVLGQNGNWGVAAPAAQAIGQAYQQNLASNTQNMANAGLGNTTVGANQANQATLGAAQAYGGLGAQLAQAAAGYQAQIGQAGLGAQMQGLQQQTGLSQAQGGALSGYQFSNTAGALAGQQSQSSSSSASQQAQQSQGAQQTNPNANPVTSGNGAAAPSLGGGGYPAGPSSFTPGGPASVSSAAAPGLDQNSPGFNSGASAAMSSGYPQTTGIQGNAGITGQYGLQPGTSSGSINPQTGYSMGFSQNGNGPGGPTTGFSGDVGYPPGNTSAPNDMQAVGMATINAGLNQQESQQFQQAYGYMSPQEQQQNMANLATGAKPLFASVGQGAAQHFVISGWQ